MTEAATLPDQLVHGQPRHTPYDGSHTPFRIGLQPLDLNDWIEVDGNLDFYLSEKLRLEKLYPGQTFMAEPDTDAAQDEVLQMLCAHLEDRFPQIYRRDRNIMHANGRSIELDQDTSPLRVAGWLVQEDLLILRHDDTGWRLVSGSLSFPSSWSLGEKFSLPLEEIHVPVPEFGTGTRNAAMINRIFDKLSIDMPVWRMNWSIYPDDELFHDHQLAQHLKRTDFGPDTYLRLEYQTLRKLPASGDILFTVRVHIDPLSTLEQNPDRQRICEKFGEMLQSLNAEQLAYKGLTVQRSELLSRLRELSASDSSDRTKQ